MEMVKGIASVIVGLILCVVVGIVLTALGKLLLAIALVIGAILIAGAILFAIFGSKILDVWKSLS
jgi:hypothetical protein